MPRSVPAGRACPLVRSRRRRGARRGSRRRRAQGRAAADAQPAAGARTAPRMGARRRARRPGHRHSARAPLPRRGESRRLLARQRDAARRRDDHRGGPGRRGQGDGRRSASRRARAPLALSPRPRRPAPRAPDRRSQRRLVRARLREGRTGSGSVPDQPARARPSLRRHRRDLLRRGLLLADPGRGAIELLAARRLRAHRLVARGLGARRGNRHPGSPRPPCAALRPGLVRGDAGRRPPSLGGAMTPRHVAKRSLLRVFFRSLFIQAAWNPRGMQNLGFASAMAPALAHLHPDRKARIAAARRHLELFNCHPYAAAAIVGGAVRLEEEVASGTATPQDVSSFKSSLASPFAALGDGFFWLALRPAAALLAALAWPYAGLYCVALFLAVYDSIHLAVRIWLFAAGYQKGPAIIEILSRAHIPAAT